LPPPTPTVSVSSSSSSSLGFTTSKGHRPSKLKSNELVQRLRDRKEISRRASMM
jgi:hypothetical protein